MKKFLLAATLLLPTISFAAQYTGHITKISLNNKGDNVIFELANTEEACESSWFRVTKAPGQEISPAEFVVKSYFANKKVTIHSPQVCQPLTSPSAVNRVTLGTSTEEVKALIQQIREKRKPVKK